MRLQIPDQQLRASARLPLAVGILAILGTALLWPLSHRASLCSWIAWAPAFFFAWRYASRSWIRVSMRRGISWRMATPFGDRLGSLALDPSAIAELRLEPGFPGRLIGLPDLQFVGPDGALSPRLRCFEGVEPLAEALHAYLQQSAKH